MASTITQSVGVDISKDALDVAIHPEGKNFRIANTPEGHRALLKKLKGFEIARVVFEATGAYHRLFQLLGRSSRPACPGSRSIPVRPDASPKPRENLPRPTGAAPLMARSAWAELLDLEPRAPASRTVEAMQELVKDRDALVKDRVAALNRQAIAVSPLIKRQLARRLRQIDGQIEAIDQHLKTLRDADPDLRQRPWFFSSSISRRRRSDPPCARGRERPSSGVSTIAKSQASQASPRSQGRAARPMGSDPSAAAARGLERPSICLPSPPSDSTPSSKLNTRS